MTKLTALLILIIAITACQKKQEPVAGKPSDAVNRYYAALNARDTGAYIKSLSQRRVDQFRKNPDLMRKLMEQCKSRHADVQILSESEEGTIGLVEYRVKFTGTDPIDTTLRLQVYKEDDGWKFGYF